MQTVYAKIRRRNTRSIYVLFAFYVYMTTFIVYKFIYLFI